MVYGLRFGGLKECGLGSVGLFLGASQRGAFARYAVAVEGGFLEKVERVGGKAEFVLGDWQAALAHKSGFLGFVDEFKLSVAGHVFGKSDGSGVSAGPVGLADGFAVFVADKDGPIGIFFAFFVLACGRSVAKDAAPWAAIVWGSACGHRAALLSWRMMRRAKSASPARSFLGTPAKNLRISFPVNRVALCANWRAMPSHAQRAIIYRLIFSVFILLASLQMKSCPGLFGSAHALQ
jgi:hypothetical protein